MANNQFETRVKSKRDTSSNWTISDPILLNGEEIIVDTANGNVRKKIGDGNNRYTQLPFSDEYIYAAIADKESLIKNNDLKESVDESDSFPLSDSKNNYNTKKVNWITIKNVLKNYFDGFYTNFTIPVTTQDEAENGVGTEIRMWTPQRVSQSIRACILTGLAIGTNSAITATDTVLNAFGKLQAQISELKNESNNYARIKLVDENTLTVLPIGEFAWVMDKNELYIGTSLGNKLMISSLSNLSVTIPELQNTTIGGEQTYRIDIN